MFIPGKKLFRVNMTNSSKINKNSGFKVKRNKTQNMKPFYFSLKKNKITEIT